MMSKVISFPGAGGEAAAQDHFNQVDDLLCSLEGIRQALDATVEGVSPELARIFLVQQFGNHLTVLRGLVLPEA
jgi:hypothetical protein